MIPYNKNTYYKKNTFLNKVQLNTEECQIYVINIVEYSYIMYMYYLFLFYLLNTSSNKYIYIFTRSRTVKYNNKTHIQEKCIFQLKYI